MLILAQSLSEEKARRSTLADLMREYEATEKGMKLALTARRISETKDYSKGDGSKGKWETKQ